jgi:replication factor A1
MLCQVRVFKMSFDEKPEAAGSSETAESQETAGSPEAGSSPETVETVKVETLTPNSRQINTTVKVVSKSPVRETVSRRDGSVHKVTDVLVGDETGSVYMTLWDDNIENVKEEDVIDIKNGYIGLFKGSMRLNLGRYGSYTASSSMIESVNTENNLSDKQYEQERRYRPRYGGRGDRYGGGDRRRGGGGGYRNFGSRRRY